MRPPCESSHERLKKGTKGSIQAAATKGRENIGRAYLRIAGSEYQHRALCRVAVNPNYSDRLAVLFRNAAILGAVDLIAPELVRKVLAPFPKLAKPVKTVGIKSEARRSIQRIRLLAQIDVKVEWFKSGNGGPGKMRNAAELR